MRYNEKESEMKKNSNLGCLWIILFSIGAFYLFGLIIRGIW